MNINLTLFGQSITFIFFVWFCLRFIWPPIMHALNTRKQQIADGLAAGEKGRHEEELGRQKATEIIKEAKEKAQEIIRQADKRASEIMDEAKSDARSEGERILAAANAEVEQELNRAREALRGQVANLAVAGAGKVLKKEIDAAANEDLLKDLVAQL